MSARLETMGQIFRGYVGRTRTRAVRIGFRVATTAIAIMPWGCGEPLVAPELVVASRVLGARIENADDPNQAWLAPNEQGLVRWFTASPEGSPALGWAFSFCVAETITRGLPICKGGSFAHVTSDGITRDEAVASFTMPDKRGMAGEELVAVSGAFCESGTPRLVRGAVSFEKTECPKRTERPKFAVVNVTAKTDEATNANPSLGGAEVLLDGREWSSDVVDSSDSTDGCASNTELLQVRADGMEHKIGLTIPAGQSEKLPQLTSHSDAYEVLQLSHFVTAGDLERVYSSVETAGAISKVTVTWRMPDTISEASTLAHLFVVLRDGRGGTDFMRRSLCIVQ